MKKQIFDIPEEKKELTKEAAEKLKEVEGLTEEQKKVKAEVDKAAALEADRLRRAEALKAENDRMEAEMYQFLEKKCKQFGVSVETYLSGKEFTPAMRKTAYEMYNNYKREHGL